MKEIIEQAAREEIISLYDDKNDTAGFYCGKVCAINESYVLLDHFDKIGRYGGYVILKNENIYRVNRGSQYEKAISNLEKAYLSKHDLTVNPLTLVNDLLNYAKEKGLVLLIELCESGTDDIQGIIKDFDEKAVSLDCVDDYGNPDGTSTVFIEDVSVIKCDNTTCQGVKALMQLSSK